MKIATWNVNSLRVRLPHLLDWLTEAQPDIVGLQELKCTDEQFPFEALAEAGYRAVANGQKTYNGVALLARGDIEDVARDIPGFDDAQRRVIAGTVGGIRIINAYVVNGQAVGSEKYAYKLRFLDAFRQMLAVEISAHEHVVVMGDFNIAPTPDDTHDPQQWEGNILCSEPERAALSGLLELGLADAFDHAPTREGRFSWWDYRQAAFRRDLGLRIDHLLVSAAVRSRLAHWAVDRTPRTLERPSDHAPVWIGLR
ncbi:exodeoxyribonuclease III [Flagellatimonas centrodinii]|uniref:exodeoxyribonuclease III n=1 Tax=Flagellatimonas centrodinii TaxID=2806210 RepID=UPI001FEF5A3D|nr:exodeoxyribonuclease III [Flagellatimonas centrodinii]ULQ47177.1 exodeoxyribonuclease III [Flagellatimonas centrodinii]